MSYTWQAQKGEKSRMRVCRKSNPDSKTQKTPGTKKEAAV